MSEHVISEKEAVSPQMRLSATPALLPLMLVSLYLMFAPVWAPAISSRVYDDARYLQLGMLLLQAAWNDLGRVVRALIFVFLVGGVISTIVSNAPLLGALELGLMVQLVFLTLLVCSLVRLHGVTANRALVVAACAGAGLICLQFWPRDARFPGHFHF